jgi:carbon-monoxide dehydrogenase medium subunit
MTRQREVERSDVVRDTLPLLRDALAYVGHLQTRNRGTIGGSLCHLDPSAELVAAAIALDATLIAESSAGMRRIAAREWGQGYLTNALAAGEMLVAIEFPAWPQGHGHAFVEYARRDGDFAIVGVATLLAMDATGAISRAAIAIGGCTAAPQRLAEAERALLGQRPVAALFKDVARLGAAIEATSDPYVTADYRRHLARVLTERALDAAAARMQGAA